MTPCTSCRRHVALDERVCPFCGAAVTPAAPRPMIAVSRLTRSAVFAGASLASGCWVDKSPPPTTPPATSQGHVDVDNTPRSTGTIHGVVTNAATGRPVEWSSIQITPNPYHAEDHERNKDA